MIQQAKIVAIDGDKITCTIECNEACAGCSAKSLCGKTDSKVIELINTGSQRSVGEVINIHLDNRSGFKAIAIAYLAPVVIIIAMLAITQAMAISELWQGLSALIAAVGYYIIIKIFGIGRSISITIVE